MIARLALAIALLAGWQAALEHPVWHVDDLGALVHLHDGYSHRGGHSDGPEGGALCDALAALTACAAETPQLLAGLAPCKGILASQDEGAPRAGDSPPFLSQGPPASA